MAGISYAGYAFYSKAVEQSIIEDYSKNFETLSVQISQTIDEFYNSVLLIELFDEIGYLINADFKRPSAYSLEVAKAKEILASFNSTRTILQEVIIYFPGSNQVLTGRGIQSAVHYFEQANRYEKYPKEFWVDFPKRRSGSFILLPPTRAVTDYGSSRLIPMVIEGIGLSKTRNLLILNIDVDELEDMVRPYLFTANSRIFLLAHDNSVYLNVSADSTSSAGLSSRLVKAVKTKDEQPTVYGKQHLIIPYTAKMLGSEWSYIAVVPLDDLSKRTQLLRTMTVSFIIAGFLFGLFFTFLSSKKMYAPIKEMVTVFARKDTNQDIMQQNEFDYLKDKLGIMLTNSERMQEDLSHTMPLAYEHCFSQIIKNGAIEYYEELNTFLKRERKEFIYDRFISVLIRYNFEHSFYHTFSSTHQKDVQSVLSKMVDTHIQYPCRTYHISLEPAVQCTVFNIPGSVDPADIKETFEQLIHSLDSKNNHIQLAVAIGDSQHGLTGIHLSYQHSRICHSTMIGNSDEPVQIYSESHGESYLFHESQRTKLKNFLLAGSKEACEEVIDRIIQENKKNSTGSGAMKLLMFRIYQTCLIIAEESKLPLDQIVPAEGTDLVNSFQMIETDKLLSLVYILCENICSKTVKRNRSSDIHNIAAYIQENYSSEIYLEQLADKFGLTYNYLSQKFKDILGVSFQQYLTDIRIRMATKLLKETNIPVKNIAKKVGYESTNTFYRVFKKHEGITATNYRNLHMRS